MIIKRKNKRKKERKKHTERKEGAKEKEKGREKEKEKGFCFSPSGGIYAGVKSSPEFSTLPGKERMEWERHPSAVDRNSVCPSGEVSYLGMTALHNLDGRLSLSLCSPWQGQERGPKLHRSPHHALVVLADWCLHTARGDQGGRAHGPYLY